MARRRGKCCALAGQDVPWAKVHVVQVDERVAPAGDADRNLTHLRGNPLSHAPCRRPIKFMRCRSRRPTWMPPPLPTPRANQDRRLASRARSGASGLGPDGHTASLIPGDAVLNVVDRDVAMTGVYQGRRRMTLTYPLINRARQICGWRPRGQSRDARATARGRSANSRGPYRTSPGHRVCRSLSGNV